MLSVDGDDERAGGGEEVVVELEVVGRLGGAEELLDAGGGGAGGKLEEGVAGDDADRGVLEAGALEEGEAVVEVAVADGGGVAGGGDGDALLAVGELVGEGDLSGVIEAAPRR